MFSLSQLWFLLFIIILKALDYVKHCVIMQLACNFYYNSILLDIKNNSCCCVCVAMFKPLPIFSCLSKPKQQDYKVFKDCSTTMVNNLSMVQNFANISCEIFFHLCKQFCYRFCIKINDNKRFCNKCYMVLPIYHLKERKIGLQVFAKLYFAL